MTTLKTRAKTTAFKDKSKDKNKSFKNKNKNENNSIVSGRLRPPLISASFSGYAIGLATYRRLQRYQLREARR